MVLQLLQDLSCLQINTNQGKFRLTATGDLQIVQVHQSDSGTYLCVADNGVGSPVEREVKLRVAGNCWMYFGMFIYLAISW